MTPQARVRRLQDTLSAVGTGVIAFAAWSLAKTALLILLFDEETQRQMLSISDELPLRLYYTVFAIVVGFDLVLRLFVGLSARAEGHGKRKGYAYLVIAALLVLGSIIGLVFIALGMTSSPSVFDSIMTVLIEITSIATLVLMIFCAVRLRRLTEPAG